MTQGTKDYINKKILEHRAGQVQYIPVPDHIVAIYDDRIEYYRLVHVESLREQSTEKEAPKTS